MIKDSMGLSVTDGDTIKFSYGIPPIQVVAPVKNIDGELWVITEGHRPEKCLMKELKRHIEHFYKQNGSGE